MQIGKILFKQEIILVTFIVLHYRQHGIFIDPSDRIIDMTIGVIAHNTFFHPQYLLHTIIIHQVGFDLRAVQPGIPVLVQQTTGRCQQRALSIEFNRPTFHDNSGVNHRNAQRLAYPGGYHIIQVIGRIFIAPGVIAPIDDHFFLFRTGIDQEGRTMIPAPGIIGRMKIEADLPHIGARFLQTIFCKGSHGLIIHVDANLFSFCDSRHETAIMRIDSLYLSRPGRFLMRPAKPGGPMPVELRGKIISELLGGGGRHFLHIVIADGIVHSSSIYSAW